MACLRVTCLLGAFAIVAGLSAAELNFTACRLSPPGGCCTAMLPGTALGILLENGTFVEPDTGSAISDPYVDTWIRDAIPDINQTGPEWWTFSYTAKILTADIPGCTQAAATAQVVASLDQGSYRITLFLDDNLVPPLSVNLSSTKGMFRRFDWVLGPAASFCAVQSHDLRFEVLPPDHPGSVSGGQGGDHLLSQDLISQDLAGWDWAPGVPDRNTGLFDALSIDIAPVGVLLRDPTVVVQALHRDPSTPPRDPVALAAFVRVSLMPLSQDPVSGTISAVLDGAVFSSRVIIPGGAIGKWFEFSTDVLELPSVRLWWPHNVGEPQLYDAVASFTPDSNISVIETRWRAGFRTIRSAVDEGLGGQVFYINGERVFLQGGNFITTDMMNRRQFRTPQRYWDEVRMHREMGMNVIRLWGGNGGAARAMWDAADELGVLLFQEFWQSGDNNGRWAGSQTWPLDHPGYLQAAADTIRMARGHPSLLLYNAGNEIFPPNETWAPPPLSSLVLELDPRDTPFEWSSMGNISEYWWPDKILAPKDGNYGINDERIYFNRNPGLSNSTMPIAFQPEIGNTAHPEFSSLSRMFTAKVRELIPPPNVTNASLVDESWIFHCWLPFTDGEGVDHVWALAPLGPTNASRSLWNASEYSLAASLVQAVQYQALFEGFSDAMWAWYSAVIMWKSAAPWPSLRGSLYDWYLAQSGGYWGARAALSGGFALHAQLNRQNNTISVVNKGLVKATGPWNVSVTAYNLSSGRMLALVPPFLQTIEVLPPNSVTHLLPQLDPPPSATRGAVLLYRVELTGPPLVMPVSSDYLVSTLNPNSSVPQDMTSLAAMRYNSSDGLLVLCVAAAGEIQGVDKFGRAVVIVNVSLSNPGPAIAVGVSVSMRCPFAAVTADTGFVDDRVLPQWADSGLINVLVGERRTLRVEGALDLPASAALAPTFSIIVDGWNVVKQNISVTMPP